MAKKWKTKEILRQTATHPLGRLTLAGLLIDYQVTGPMPMRFWDTFVAVYVLAGRARFHDETGLSLPVRPGDLLLMFPGHGYHYDIDPRRPWSEFALHFQGRVFDLWRQLKILDPARPIYHLKPIEPWMERFERVVRPRRTRRASHLLKQVCQWQELLSDILAEGRGQKSDRPQNLWLGQATALLDKQSLAEPIE